MTKINVNGSDYIKVNGNWFAEIKDGFLKITSREFIKSLDLISNVDIEINPALDSLDELFNNLGSVVDSFECPVPVK